MTIMLMSGARIAKQSRFNFFMKALQATLAIFCCHILTGTASVSTRYLVTVLDPVEIAFLRYFIGGFAMLPLFFLFRSRSLNKVLLLKIAGLGVLFFALFPFLFSWSFVYTTAARGSLVIATMPIWAMLISKAIGHERINGLSLLAMALTIFGLTIALSDKLLMSSGEAVIFKGELIMLLTALVGAIYAILSRHVLRQVPASTMTPLAMLTGCLFLFPFSIARGIDVHLMALSSQQLWLIVYLGIVAGGIAFFLFNWALNKSTATYTTLFVALNPITAIFLGNIFLDEVITANFIVGVLVVFFGLGLAVKSQISDHPI
ncbi:MAG: drug/metabolite transporter (DMT)-like permease [Gammaproteobacteria bacterium]|jgi:drug/metabolite transporter (DMT)-like permease